MGYINEEGIKLLINLLSKEKSLFIPKLNNKQKTEIKKLMSDYLANNTKFIYDGTFRRESYAYPVKTTDDNMHGCINSEGKYYLNCGLLAQMVWMGRSIDDFVLSYPSTKINKEFDWGYYFDFLAARNAYGIMKNSTTYYSANTYENSAGETCFITFDNAAAMAMELYYKGYEIPYSLVDIGDLVFYRTESEIDGSGDELEQTSFLNITHVGLVYDMDEDGIPLILECSNAYSKAVGKASLSNKHNVSNFGLVRGAGLTSRVCMAARHPAAWGDGYNVPEYFETYRH